MNIYLFFVVSCLIVIITSLIIGLITYKKDIKKYKKLWSKCKENK